MSILDRWFAYGIGSSVGRLLFDGDRAQPRGGRDGAVRVGTEADFREDEKRFEEDEKRIEGQITKK